MERLRRMFGRTGTAERKIAHLAEQRAALTRQRDRAYEELSRLEKRESELRDQFVTDESTSARRRITSQLLQLQKDLEQRRQTLGVINQQINVISTNLHNLEIARTGIGTRIPSSDQIAADAARAEEVLAELQVSSELADELTSSVASTTSSAEEQRLFEELTAAANAQKQAASAPPEANAPVFAREVPVTPRAKPEKQPAEAEPAEPTIDFDGPEPDAPAPPQRGRAEPEAN